jgi:hypothetical protein
MPRQLVSAPPSVYRAIRRVDLDMAWADSLSGLARAEANSTNRWVAYDLEDWTVSGSDRADPLGSLARFGRRAHADGFRVIMTPAFHFAALGPASLDRFESIVRVAARYGDVVDLQLERFDCAPRVFGRAARRFTAIARAVHPGIPVLVNQVTPNPRCSIRPAWIAAKPFVSGRWVWDL